MANLFRILLLSFVLVLAVACKSEYERIRTSGDPERIYKAANEYYEEGKYERALSLYEMVVNSFRGDPRLQEAYYRYANSYFETGQYLLASYHFRTFADTYPVSDMRRDALYMEAMSYVNLSPGYRLDQKYTDKAQVILEQYLNTYPDDTERVEKINRLLSEFREKQEEKAYQSALLYYNMAEYQAAVHEFERVLQDFPDTDHAEDVRYQIARSHINFADNSVVAKRRERYEDALDAIAVYLKKYPKGSKARELRRDKNRITELLNNNDTYVRY